MESETPKLYTDAGEARALRKMVIMIVQSALCARDTLLLRDTADRQASLTPEERDALRVVADLLDGASDPSLTSDAQ